MDKAEVRSRAAALGLATAAKPDSQDVCFITATGGRHSFLSERMPLTPGRVVDGEGRTLGQVPAVELVTVGQRRGLGSLGPDPAYAVAVDPDAATVTVGRAADLLAAGVDVGPWAWVDQPFSGPCLVQVSAHGQPVPATIDGDSVVFEQPQRRVARGQSVVAYDGDRVLGGGPAL
jgi:tRNA-specific 2-thiouridylase